MNHPGSSYGSGLGNGVRIALQKQSFTLIFLNSVGGFLTKVRIPYMININEGVLQMMQNALFERNGYNETDG